MHNKSRNSWREMNGQIRTTKDQKQKDIETIAW